MINDNLAQQIQSLFQHWFIGFNIWNVQKPSDLIYKPLSEISTVLAGGDKPKIVNEYKTHETPYPIFSNGIANEGLYGYTNIPKIKEESVTISARGTIGYVALRHEPYVPIVRLISVIPNNELLNAKYLYLYLRQLNIMGTGTTQQQLTVPDFSKTIILLPKKSLLERFTYIITPMFETIWANEKENKSLISLRDGLLPKLISGEIDVSNIKI